MKHKTLSYLRFAFCGLLILAFAMPAMAQKLDMEQFKGMKARAIGPAGMSGRVTAVDVVLSDPDIIYIGSASGGLWKSTNGGINWQPLFDEQKVASIGAIAIVQSNPDVIYVGTGEGNPRNTQTSGNGMYKTLDGGKTWTHLGLDATRNIHRVIVHPKNPDIVFVGAQGSAWGDTPDRGVYKSTDGGKTWKKILYNNERTGIAELVMDPDNPNKLFAAMWEFRRWPWFFKSGGPGSGLYVTFDGGATWKKRTDEDGLPKGELGRVGIAIARSNPNIVYALIEAKKTGFYRSDDGGFKWKL
ncbi:MAG: WD40/YVTN/BNR-like repeat-containing protein, partial [bacterium]